MRLWEGNDKGFCQNILVKSLTHLEEDYVILNISSIVYNSCFLLAHQDLIYKIRAASDIGQKGVPKLSSLFILSFF